MARCYERLWLMSEHLYKERRVLYNESVGVRELSKRLYDKQQVMSVCMIFCLKRLFYLLVDSYVWF